MQAPVQDSKKPICAEHEAPALGSCQRCGDFFCMRCLKDPVFTLCRNCFEHNHKEWLMSCEEGLPRFIALRCLLHFVLMLGLVLLVAVYINIETVFPLAYPIIVAGAITWEIFRFAMKRTRLGKDYEVRAVKYRRCEQKSIDSIEAFIKLSEEEQETQRQDFVAKRAEIRKLWEQRSKEEANRDIELEEVPAWLSFPFFSACGLLILYSGLRSAKALLALLFVGYSIWRIVGKFRRSESENS